MAEIDFLLDENVPSSLYTGLISRGYAVEYAQDRYGEGTDDYDQLLADSGREEFVLVTNDKMNFGAPPENIPHGGVLLYARASLINDRTGDALDAIDRILSHYSREGLRNQVVWITVAVIARNPDSPNHKPRSSEGRSNCDRNEHDPVAGRKTGC